MVNDNAKETLSVFPFFSSSSDYRLISLLVRGEKWWRNYWRALHPAEIRIRSFILFFFFVFWLRPDCVSYSTKYQFPLLAGSSQLGKKLIRRNKWVAYDVQVLLVRSCFYYFGSSFSELFGFFPVDLGVSNQVRVIRVESVAWKSSTKVWPTLKVVSKSCWFVPSSPLCLLFCWARYYYRLFICFATRNDSAKMAARRNWKCPTLLLITLILWLNAAHCQQTGNEIFDSSCCRRRLL